MSFTSRLVPGLKAQGIGGLAYVAVNPVMDIMRRVVRLDPTMTAAATAGVGVLLAGVIPQGWRESALGGWGAESSRMLAKSLNISFLQPANYAQLADAADQARLQVANSGQVQQLENGINDALSAALGRKVNLRGDELIKFMGAWKDKLHAAAQGKAV